jgi:glycosyltransferase involved in cell wall biosynthesis
VVSFIIPAHNEEQLLGLALDAIANACRQLAGPYEVIVASDGSTDRTEEIAAERGARVVNLDRRQISAARNAGAKEAIGDLLIFVDADTQVTEEAVYAAIRAMRRGAVGGGSGVRFDGKVPLYASAIEYLIRLVQPIVGLAPGCFLFCTREAYLQSGGYDETLFVSEEVFFAMRLRNLGRFVILREYVITSARKLRTRSALELVMLAVRLLSGGLGSARRREGLEYWYGPREADQLE